MAQGEIMAGACGFTTRVTAIKQGKTCRLTIESDCQAIKKMAGELTEVDPLQEISFRKGMPRILEMGIKYCIHAACPVPVGIVKTMETAAGLNLAVDATIKIVK